MIRWLTIVGLGDHGRGCLDLVSVKLSDKKNLFVQSAC